MSENQANPTITDSDICLSCGLCCSGAVFLWGDLEAHEHDVPERLGLRRYPEEGTQAIGFPCPAIVNRCCTVYEGRPQVCRNYRCGVLLQFGKGEMSGERAIEIVTEAVTLASAANDGYPSDMTKQRFDNFGEDAEWKSLAQIAPTEQIKRRLALMTLERLLDKHFRLGKQRHVTVAPAPGPQEQQP